MVVKQRMTEQSYLALPEEKPYLEYIDGEAVAKSMPDMRHVDLCDEIQHRLRAYRDGHGGRSGPEARIEFCEGEVVQFRLPDVSYWAAGRSRAGERAMLPPTLAVEVRSPDETATELRAKCWYCRNHGVDIAWLVDPDSRTVEIFEADREGVVLRNDDVVRSTRLPGFALQVNELFAVLDT